MKITHKSLLSIGLLGCILNPCAWASAEAEKLQMGRALFTQGRCMVCHASRPFASASSRIKTYSTLTTMVETCNTNLGLGWFPDEVEAVSYFLNKHYYKLPIPALAEEE